ncbi:wax ester/triacylglycerol synthase domain-containing protein [Gordonia sp. NPDC003424]
MIAEHAPNGEAIAAADVANLVFDTGSRVNTFVLAGLLGSGGFVLPDGDIDIERARTVLIARAETVPRFRQRADTTERVWRWQDATIDPTRHVRVVDAPSLEDLCAHCMTTHLDYAYPLWEILLVPRIGDGRAGIVIRIHHAIADGLAAATMVAALADPASLAPRVHRRPDTEPRGPRRRFGQLWRVATAARVPSGSVLLGSADGPGSIRFAEIDLRRFRAGADTAHGTINDGVLAAVAGALSATLRELGETPPEAVAVSVPVAMHRPSGHGNAIGSAIVSLPLRIDDSADRIRVIHPRALQAIDDAHHAGDFPPVNSRWLIRQFDRYSTRQRRIGLVTSNVPGPTAMLAFDGAPLVSMHGIGTLGGNVRISIVAASYAGVLSFGVHTARAIPADTLTAALVDQIEEIASPASD